jgi:hypothetical protein
VGEGSERRIRNKNKKDMKTERAEENKHEQTNKNRKDKDIYTLKNSLLRIVMYPRNGEIWKWLLPVEVKE